MLLRRKMSSLPDMENLQVYSSGSSLKTTGSIIGWRMTQDSWLEFSKQETASLRGKVYELKSLANPYKAL